MPNDFRARPLERRTRNLGANVAQNISASLSLQHLAQALGGDISRGQILAPGPGHSPQDRSLAVKPDANAPDGFLVHSFAGDDPIACRDHVRDKAGLPAFKPNGNGQPRKSDIDFDQLLMRALAAQAKSANPSWIIATFPYTDEHGTLLYQVLKYEPKGFSQRRPDGNGRWINDLDGVRRVLYRLPELLAYPDGTVFFCEGEKDANRVADLGHCATTVAGGKWTDECVRALAGRDILILEDNDEAGRKKALATAQALHGTAASIRIVRLPDLPEKGDVSDWLDAHPRNADRLVDICFDAPLWAPDTTKDNKQTFGTTASTPSQSGEIILCRAADVEAQSIDWIWNGRIARGKLTLIAGDPGLGKSQIGIDLHARVSIGARWPDGEHAPIANGIILSAEDSSGDTPRPRLEAADADLQRIWILDAVRTKDGKRSFTLQEDLRQLGNKIAEIGDVAMITIDPITSYMGKINSHRTTDVRAVLEPLAAFAEEYNVAILAVSHPPKAVQAKAIHAVSGSLAFVAAARMVFIVVEEPETGRRLMLPTKNNLAALPAGLAYRLEQLMVSKSILASHVVWDSAPVTVNANQALAEDRENARGDDALREAKDFLREALAAGPRPAKDIEEDAKAAGITDRTLRRARKVLKVKATKGGFVAPWIWSLP